MNEEEFIGILQACYFGNREAFNTIVIVFKELKEENNRLKTELENKRMNNVVRNNKHIELDDNALDYLVKTEQENYQLKEALENIHYCPYDDKCGELYDCTKEEYQGMIEANVRLSNENSDLKDRIEKALEYINKHEKDGTLWFVKSTDELKEILKGE